ncbi:MAG: type II toxin-antitoxin system prevent-host-death family antitoxin [Pseudomonadota bacterium]
MQSRNSVSITELKANPIKAVTSGLGSPIAVMNRSTPVFYCVPASTYRKLMETIAELESLVATMEPRKL